MESIHCRAARVMYNLSHNMPSEDARKTANWVSLFDTYKVKIATLIYNIYNRITPSCLEHIIQRKEKETSVINIMLAYNVLKLYYMKNAISYRGSIVWNLLEPSAVSARDYAKRAKKSHALRNLNFNGPSPNWQWFSLLLILLYLLLCIFHLLLTTFNFNNFYYFINIFYMAP